MSWDVKYRGYSEPPPPSKRFYQQYGFDREDIVVYSGDKTEGVVISKDDLEVVAKYKQMDLVFDEEMTIKKQAFNELRIAYFEAIDSVASWKSKIAERDHRISALSKQINRSEEREKELASKIKELEGKLSDALHRPTFTAIVKDWLAIRLHNKRNPVLLAQGPYR